MKRTLWPLLIILFLYSCTEDFESEDEDYYTEYIDGVGAVIEHDLGELPMIDAVTSGIEGRIRVTRGPVQKVTIYAQENIFRLIEYEVDEGHFTVSMNPDVNIRNAKEVEVNVQLANEVEVVSMFGSGRIDLQGESQKLLTVLLVGTGQVDAFDLPVERCLINVVGAGDCKLNVSKEIAGVYTGIGNIQVKGSPLVNLEGKGYGSISFED